MRISPRNDSRSASDSPENQEPARRFAGETGAVVVLFGLALIGLLAMIAIVVDLGNTRQVKRQLQSAADAAALAGANSLGGTDFCTAAQGAAPTDPPVTAAAKYTFNNLSLSTPTPTSSGTCAGGGTWKYSLPSNANLAVNIVTPYAVGSYPNSMLMRVEACKDVPTTFAKVIGVSTVHVCVHATALKTGASGNGGGGGGGTGSSDPDAPCAIDDFLANGYFDSNSPPNALNDGTADANHSGGTPGGAVGEGKIVGATFYSTAFDINNTAGLQPYFYLQNVTAGTKTTIATSDPNFHIHAMTSVVVKIAGVNTTIVAPPGHLYQIQWKIPSGNANNSAYSIGMGVNDTNPITHASCGRTTWSFVKGTVPAGAPGSVCGEDAFLNTLYPASGIAVPGNYVGANYQDESILNTNYDTAHTPPTYDFRVTFIIDKGTANEIILRAPGQGDATHPEYELAQGPVGKEKFSTLIQYKLPATLGSGSHTVYLKAYDGDQNAAGGDCGIGNWTFSFSGTPARVKLVE